MSMVVPLFTRVIVDDICEEENGGALRFAGIVAVVVLGVAFSG